MTNAQTEVVFETLESRRVVRDFTEEPVSLEDLRAITNAAILAPSGSNRRIHKFLVVRDSTRIKLVKTMSPGLTGNPPAIIVLLSDTEVAAELGVQMEKDSTNWIDVGTSAMNMMIAAEALGLGTCPVTSLSQTGVREMLDLPVTVIPELVLLVGHPRTPRARKRASQRLLDSLSGQVHWEQLKR